MDASSAPRPSAGGADSAGFNAYTPGAPGAKMGGNRRLTNMEQHLLAEDNAAAGAAGYYGARGQGIPGVAGGLGMYGAAANDPAAQGAQAARLSNIYGAVGLGGAAGLGNAGLRGVPGLMPGQFDDPSGGLAGLQAAQSGISGAAGFGGLNGLGQGLQQQQQQAMAARQHAAGDFQGLMPTGFDGTDASAALLGNPAAMAGYPFQAGFNPAAAAAGLGETPAAAGLLNQNAAALGGAVAQNRFGNGAGPSSSLFDQGYNFARSEMLARHQAALNNNAALMGAGGGQAGLHLAGLDRQGAAGLRGLGPGGVNPYSNYGADPLMGAAGPVGTDPYSQLGRAGPGGDAAGAGHLATIPAIRLAQHRSALQRRMLVNNLPERKDGSFPVVLYQESDEHKLTAYQCLLRKQLELFEADEDDVRCSTRQGRTAPIKLGQVGLRCRHCAGVQLAARTKGAAYYSQTVEGIYQIAQNMSKVHLCERCYRIPRDVRRQLIVLRSDCRRAIGGKEYWSENIRALGVYVDEGILRVKKAPKDESKEEDGDKKGGEGETKDETMKVKAEEGEATKEGGEGETKDETMEVKAEDGEATKEGETSAADVKTEDEDKKEEEKPSEEKTDEATPMDEDKKEDETEAEKETMAPEETPEETPSEAKPAEAETKDDDEAPKDEEPSIEEAPEAKEDEAVVEDKKEDDGDEKMDEEPKEEDKKEDEPEAAAEETVDAEPKEDAPEESTAMEVEKKEEDKKEEEEKEAGDAKAEDDAKEEKTTEEETPATEVKEEEETKEEKEEENKGEGKAALEC